MKYLIVFFDRSTLKNIVPTLAIAPDVIKYFYDPDVFSYYDIYSTFEACRKYIPGLRFEVGALDEHDYAQVYETVETMINHTHPDEVCIDLTGGSELAVIAGYEAGMCCGCDVYYTDIWKNKLFWLNAKQCIESVLPFDMEDLVTAFGGKLLGYSDDDFLWKYQKSLFTMSDYLIHRLNRWLRTSQYLQKYNSRLRQESRLHFKAPFEHSKNDTQLLPDMTLLEEFQKQGLIRYLSVNEKHVEFAYANVKMMDYMSSYGVWLELYTYYHLLRMDAVRDVHTSLKVDWNAHDHIEIIGNEIDVTCMYKSRPVIISCKQSTGPITADTLNELYVVSRRIGGKYAIPILVTCSDMKTKHLALYLKAKEMGIHLLDISDVRSGSFLECLKRIITAK